MMSKRNRSAAVALAILGAFLAGGAARAQDEKAEKADQPEKAEERRTPADSRTISFRFPGGSVGDYLEMVKKAVGETYPKNMRYPVNIVMDDAATMSHMGGMDLKDVDIKNALMLIQQVADPPIELGRAGDIYVFRMNVRRGRESVAVLSLEGLVSDGQGGAKAEGRYKAETVLTAVEQALKEMDAGPRGASIKFHPESRLLIVKGFEAQIELVKQVVEKLKEGADKSRESVHMEEIRKAAARSQTLELEIQKLMVDKTAFQAQNEELRRQVAERQKALERKPAER